MERQQDYVLRTVEERGVRLIRLWFTDVLGQLKSVAISPAELENAFEEGMHFDGSAIDGFSRVQESDVLAKPDPNSFELLPWAKGDDPSARMFCDILNHDGEPFEGDPRQVLKRNLDKAREQGFSFYVAPEMEFFYFGDGDPSEAPKPLDSGSYFDLTTADVASDLRKRTIHMLEAMGIPVEYSFHEDAPSQHEIDLRYTDALSMADNVMTFRLVVREIALEQGVYATFMPKPLERRAGLGHAHPPVAVRGRHQRLPRARRPLRAVEGGARVHRRPARARARDHRRHQPAGQLLQAADRGLRGAGLRHLGPQQPLGAGAGAGHQVGQAVVDPHRVPLPRSGVQPLPGLLGAAGRRAPRHPRRLRAAAGGVGQRVRAHRRGAGRRGHPAAAPVAQRGARRDGAAPSWSPSASASTSSSGSCATSGPNGSTTSPR